MQPFCIISIVCKCKHVGRILISFSLPSVFFRLVSFFRSPFVFSPINYSCSSRRSGYIQLTRLVCIPVSCDGSLYHRFALHVLHTWAHTQAPILTRRLTLSLRHSYFSIDLSSILAFLLRSISSFYLPFPVSFYRKSKCNCKIKSISSCTCVAEYIQCNVSQKIKRNYSAKIPYSRQFESD